jgi:hypothetical protein
MSGRRLGVLAALGAALLLGACGVPLQSQPQPLPADVIPAPLPTVAPSPSPTQTPSSTASPSPTPSLLRLWFVREDGLVSVDSTIPTGSAPSTVLDALATGPAPDQLESGLRTIAVDPLTGLPLVTVPPVAPTPPPVTDPPPTVVPLPQVVTVQLSSAFSVLPPTEQVLLLGQVVLSLTGDGAESVSFTDEAGTTLAVPLPDGRLLDVPARARDYTSLIVQP